MAEAEQNGINGVENDFARKDPEALRTRLFTSSTKKRILELQSLKTQLASQGALQDENILILDYLVDTYPLYVDRGSRQAVQQCLRALLRTDQSHQTLNYLSAFLKQEKVKSVIAPSSLFVLVEWCSIILQEIALQPDLWPLCGQDIIESQAILLEKCVASNERPSREDSAFVTTRRAFRFLAKSPLSENVLDVAIAKLSAKGPSSTPANSLLLGILAGVYDRLNATLLKTHASHYYSFYSREILGSRTILPKHIANGLNDFFASSAVSTADIEKEISPALEKALLRAPEVVLNNIIHPLIKSLPHSIDLSVSLKTNLMKPLLSNVKSSNQAVRDGALTAFELVAAKSRDQDILHQAADELLKSLKEAKSADHRVFFASMLAALLLQSSTASKLLSAITSVATKETNESALTAEIKALGAHTVTTISSGESLDPSLSKSFVAGLGDKKPSVRKIWALRFGAIVWTLEKQAIHQPALVQLAEEVIPKLIQGTEEISANVIAATQSGAVTIAYVLVALWRSRLTGVESAKLASLIKKTDLVQNALGTDSKPSFLTNHRVYSKISFEEDQLWCTRALAAVSVPRDSPTEGQALNLAWGQAILYTMMARSVIPNVRSEAGQILETACLNRPSEAPKIIVESIWRWLQSLILDEKDSAAQAARSDKPHLQVVLNSLSSAFQLLLESNGLENGPIVRSLLTKLLVPCREPLIPRSGWINLCLRSGIDPASVVAEMPTDCLEEVKRHTASRSDGYSTQVYSAACDAAAELAFVAPDAVTPLLIDLIGTELDPAALNGVGPTEAAIFRTPEGTPYVDVLSQKAQDRLDKNTKDYDILKWEQELREHLAKKQGQQKKLTPDEQAKVKAQLAKEAEIRSAVQLVETRLMRGIGIALSLAKGPPSDTESWIGPVVNNLLALIKAGAELLIGDAAARAYIACADQVATRLGSMRPFIGVASLRSYGVAHLPNELTEEDLGDLVTRVLYRLRFSGEQRPFDLVSLTYMLPLVGAVLEKGGVGRASGEDADEQITLSLEFLSFHTDIFSDSRLPREYITNLLITAMQKFTQHYRILKDCLLGVAHAIAPNSTDAELSSFLRGCIVPESSVRNSCLQALDNDLDLQESSFFVEIWLACYESNEENVNIANSIWEENMLQIDSESGTKIIPYLEAKAQTTREAAARSLAAFVQEQEATFAEILSTLQELYVEKAKPRIPEKDAYGLPRKMDLTDPWEARHGVALAFYELARIFVVERIVPFVKFLVENGPLADQNDRVRDQMVTSASTLVSLRGQTDVESLMKIFETTLEAPDSGSKDRDKVNEAVIILYGALAQHLKAGDQRIQVVINRLIASLSTPSETVQFAIAGCLQPLVQNSREEASAHVQRIMAELLESKKYASRRGAAYGLAGIVKGCGISCLREFRILSSLRAASEEKKDPNKRQGAFLAYELLSLILGPIFEPYVIQIVPQLLTGFGDSSTDVREACLDAAKTCFATLSSFGVKQILPTLLDGLNEQAWRSKKGACDSLGAMAYLDPQQLAVSLPDIIPPLTNVLNDSHKEVRTSANRSLQRFGDVINNPEIKSLVDILLRALSDPTKYTEQALDSLLKVNFVHYLDAPSLALVVRILERGLSDRSATKRKSAQVIGSLAHLTERKDLIPNLPILVSGLRKAAVDPVPATRATASKALGSLVEKLGEDALPDLIPSLMSALKTDTGAGDRLGSAQALSEVLAGLGISRLEETLPSILQNVASSKSSVREGFMSLFIFLPACFGSSFANYLNRIIPPILTGLADEIETIRETALRAGRLLVKNFATRAIDLLLPELQRGLADDSHRIRLSSVELIGDLLFNLTGISTKSDEEEEVEENAGAAGASLLEVLGEEKRNNVLSALYISRCDTSGLVRAAAINVWKALVATPRTLREITPTLTQVIIRRLASSNMEHKIIAGNALGELIRKAGEEVLASLLPTLEDGLQLSVDQDSKQGICIALRELMAAASVETLEEYEPKLVSVVKIALVDPNDDVREAAAEAFDSMQRMFGKKVVDQVLPNLLGQLQKDDEAESALAALLTLLTDNTRSNIILPNLLPTLLASPITAFNAKAVASLATVAGSSMNRRLKHLIEALMDNIVICKDPERLEALTSAFDAVLLSVDEYDGLNTGMSLMLGLVKDDDHRKRAAANWRLATFFSEAKVDYSRYHADLIRALLISFDDRDSEVVEAAWNALNELTSKLRKETMESLVISTRQTLHQVGVPGHELPGFLLPKGINAVLPIFLQGLINGSTEQRIQSAWAISDIIDKSSSESLDPFVGQITGPLIRVVSERSTDVKAAIMLTVLHLLEKLPPKIKPFLPQLQKTFTKCLTDSSSEILRTRAVKALGTLVTLTPRIDPLVAELVTASKTVETEVKSSVQSALFEVVSKVGGKMNETSRTAITSLIDADSASAGDTAMITNARLLGALVKNLSTEVSSNIIKTHVLTTNFSKSSVLALNAVLLESPETLTHSFATETIAAISKGIAHSDSAIAQNSVLAAGKYLLTNSSSKTFDGTKDLFEALAARIQPSPAVDLRRLSLVVIRTVSREDYTLVRPHLSILAPPIFASVKDPVIPIKLGAEAAFLTLFCVVDEESAVFEKYLAGPGANLPPNTKRSMQDYFKRVALRLGGQARERREAEGGQGGLGLSDDEKEDEREIWSVGKVDLGEDSFEK